MKKYDPLAALTPKKRRYVKERVKGKSKMKAALASGHTESMARVAGSKIETPDVRAAFQALIRQRIPTSKIADRLAEGLDAMETKFATFEGRLSDRQDLIAWSERREYLKLAAEYGGYFVPRQEFSMSESLSDLTDEQLAEKAAALTAQINGNPGNNPPAAT